MILKCCKVEKTDIQRFEISSLLIWLKFYYLLKVVVVVNPLSIITLLMNSWCLKSTAFDLAFHGRRLLVYFAYQLFSLRI